MALPTEIELQIVTPERLLVHERVDEVQVPGSSGYFGVLPGHTPMLASLKIGELWYRKGQHKTYLSIAFGFAEVLPDRVTILARLAERAEDIDLERAKAARQRAERRLAEQNADLDRDRAVIALLKSIVRADVAARAGNSQRTTARGVGAAPPSTAQG